MSNDLDQTMSYILSKAHAEEALHLEDRERASVWLEVWAEDHVIPQSMREIGEAMIEAYAAGRESKRVEDEVSGD